MKEGIHGCDAAPLGETGCFLLGWEASRNQEWVTLVLVAEVEVSGKLE